MRHTRKYLKKTRQTLKKVKRHTKTERNMKRKLRKGGGTNEPSKRFAIIYSYYDNNNNLKMESYMIFDKKEDAEKAFDEYVEYIFDEADHKGYPEKYFIFELYPNGSARKIKESLLEDTYRRT
jgi:hypothetical protein